MPGKQMQYKLSNLQRRLLLALTLISVLLFSFLKRERDDVVHHYLYVATPGVRNYLEYGGHGLLVFDMDHDYHFVKRIPTGGLDKNGKPSNVKGICGNAATHRVYISTIESLICINLLSEKKVWEISYDGGCD